MKKSIVVKVDRRKWFRGKGYRTSRLLRETDMKMCCIGFLACSLGVEQKDILGRTTLTQVGDCKKFADKNDDVLRRAYLINDSHRRTDTTREAKLIELGKQMKVKFQFIN